MFLLILLSAEQGRPAGLFAWQTYQKFLLFVPGQTIIVLFSRVLQKNSAWSFDSIFFWLFIFTGRDTSGPSRHSCWSREHRSHWRNFSGIPFLFGGICVPVSNSLYWKTCIPKRCRMKEGIMKPIQLTELLSAYSLIWYSSNMDWNDAPMHTRCYLQCWETILLGSLSHCFFVKSNNAWNAFKRITRENEISQ